MKLDVLAKTFILVWVVPMILRPALLSKNLYDHLKGEKILQVEQKGAKKIKRDERHTG